MNIIICGAGRVGFTIAKLLSEQKHSITVVDQSSEDIQKIKESLDVNAIVGKATYPSILEKANGSEADMIIAVTRNDEKKILDIIKESLSKSANETFSVAENLSIPLREARENFEKEYLVSQIKKFGGNISKTAKFVGMERSALHRKLKLLGVKDLN